ncbi:hypothetical protein CKAN_01989000 [Cinnamomum micranthum f. kanehirae]|uniref:Uncharacterized protein n=1 Tax=Cinnamomum micranthum f. kanehirae TaxID=337451 RepID=A0A443PJ34_9MAGN|nr:hypothetical protein CKAN_01989000 [Cinnamomum micranthum f. kanehirae]
MANLVKHQDMQDKLVEEMERVMEKEKEVTEEHLDRLSVSIDGDHGGSGGASILFERGQAKNRASKSASSTTASQHILHSRDSSIIAATDTINMERNSIGPSNKTIPAIIVTDADKWPIIESGSPVSSKHGSVVLPNPIVTRFIHVTSAMSPPHMLL